jgi:catechol 2,3-dioxygenase-like lactoylglutathione lyase family enzyme
MLEFEVQYLRVFDRALRFYIGTLGLNATVAYEGWAQFDTGACQLAIERVDPEEDEAVVESLPGLGQSLVGRFVGASLRVIDIDATYRDLLAKGVEFVEPPERMPWGGVLAHFKDPDGNILTLLGS